MINIKIFICSQEFGGGYIKLSYDKDVTKDLITGDFRVLCINRICNISFKSDFEDFTSFFTRNYLDNMMTTVDLSNLKIIPKNIVAMFSNCKDLKTVKGLSRLNTSEITDMSIMFQFCDSLSEIDFSNFDTSKVTNMNGMFKWSTGLSSLDLSSFNTSLVQDMNQMFLGCSSLKSLDISNFYLNNKDYSGMFVNVKLKYINIYNIIYTGSNFLEDSLIKDSIDDGLMVCQKEKIIENVTYGCCLFDVDNLKCVNYLRVKYGNETEYKNGFGFIKNDKSKENKYRTDIYYILNDQNYILINESFTITANSEITIYFKEKIKSIEHFFDSEYDPNVENITQIDLSNLLSDNLVKTNSLFKGCNSLKLINLTFLNKVSLINMDSMFTGCSSLESIDFSYINTSTTTNMDSLFSGCSLIKEINLSNFNVKSLTSMNSMFKNCSSLEEIILPEFNSEKETDICYMFAGCSSLKSLNISVFKKLIASKMESMFTGCNSIQLLNLSEIKTSSVTNMSHLFEECS